MVRDRILGVVRVSSGRQVAAINSQTQVVRAMCERLAASLLEEEGATPIDIEIVKVVASAYRDEPLYEHLEAFFPQDRALRCSHCNGGALGFAVRAIVIFDWDRLTRNEETFVDMCERWFHRLGTQIVLAGSPETLHARFQERREQWDFPGLPASPVLHYNPCQDPEGRTFQAIVATIRLGHLESAGKTGFTQYA